MERMHQSCAGAVAATLGVFGGQRVEPLERVNVLYSGVIACLSICADWLGTMRDTAMSLQSEAQAVQCRCLNALRHL